eukprot:CAMPEP_0203920632 /NCGR_PEP_ID=MMETSP0359-20131031/60917_1 /ASSEMBLY_ACC=CAM_ASM_000338 /TAXON_ID=268821 /ORGANISM="Scrippsiella Hangoei, Strain SHTV-5" /LENGTH=132 /DNA_ID=CAMNT_0050848177 /DNA_START=106 /DNA_END=504 /DNA_ORIENTATION=+
MSQTAGGNQTPFEAIGSRAVSAAALYPRYEQPPRPTSTKCSISALALDVPVPPRALRGEEKPTRHKGLTGLTAKQMRSLAECTDARELQWKLNMNCSAAMMRRLPPRRMSPSERAPFRGEIGHQLADSSEHS